MSRRAWSSVLPVRSWICVLIILVVLAIQIHFFKLKTRQQVKREKCMRVAYLKTPKTGSSTLACILIRFGLTHNVSVYLPRDYKITKEKKNYLLANQKSYGIFATHAVYDNYFFTHIVRDPAIIGMVRDPIQTVISFIFWNKGNQDIKPKKESSDEIHLADIISNFSMQRGKGYFNGMTYTFGIDASRTSVSKMNEHLNVLNKEFSLVLVLEKFNESLILLKRILNWSFGDILYGKRKVNNYGTGHLTENQLATIKSHNEHDYVLYNFFKNELEKKISNAGKDFYEEVKYFETILDQASAFCSSRPSPDAVYVFSSSKWDDSFTLKARDCRDIFISDDWELKEGRFNDD